MTDIETVVNGLNDISGFIAGRVGFEQARNFLRTIDDAIELLKEQEPKQIVRKQLKRENSDGSIDYFADWYCPHCEKLLKRGFDAPWMKFCCMCGKAVKWE